MGVQVIPIPIEVVSYSLPFPPPIPCFIPIAGSIESARAENSARSKTQGWKTREWKKWHQNVCLLS